MADTPETAKVEAVDCTKTDALRRQYEVARQYYLHVNARLRYYTAEWEVALNNVVKARTALEAASKDVTSVPGGEETP